MKILYFYQDEWEREFFSKSLEGENNITFLKGSIQENPDYWDAEAEILSIFVNSHVGAEEMERFPNLKFIAARSTGFDHINLEEAQKRGIKVSNVPTYGENTVAEFAMALLLAISRKIYPSYDRVLKEGKFSQEGLRGFDLMGKTMGVVGGGNIGRHMIRMAKGFDMTVLVFDIHRDEEFAKKAGFTYADFDELLEKSDVISLHVPYNPHTHHLINSENISRIKKGAYIINTSRGEVIETMALVEALKKDSVAGAGLDVLEEEGSMGDETTLLFEEHTNPEELKIVLANQYLIDHPQVIITPHNAFNTQEAIERIFKTTIKNIEAFKKGTIINPVS